MLISNPQPSSLALDVDIPTLIEIAQPITANVSIATTMDTSLPCAEDLATTDVQQTPPSAGTLEGGPKDLAVGEDQADHLAERETNM